MVINGQLINRQSQIEIFDTIGHVKVLSTLDLEYDYHQLPVRQRYRHKTAF